MPDDDVPTLKPAALPTERAQSFFLSNLTITDWIGLAAAAIAFVGVLGWIMDKVAAASVAEVKTEVALVKAGVTNTEANLKAAFNAHAQSVNETVGNALNQRTDEIARSLVAMFGDGNTVVVRVANVPMNDPAALTAVNDFTTKFAAGTTLATFGSKAVIEAVVDGVLDEKARSLQGMIETLDGHPDVQTDIFFADPEQLGALRAKFLQKEAR